MAASTKLCAAVRAGLRRAADPQRAAAAARYHKRPATALLGVRMPEVKQVVKGCLGERAWSRAPLTSKVEAGLSLLQGRIMEEQLAGAEVLLRLVCAGGFAAEGDAADSPSIATLLGQIAPHLDAHVADWATCDALSYGVLHRALCAEPAAAMPVITGWAAVSESLWRRRAACVSLVKIAGWGGYTSLALARSETRGPPDVACMAELLAVASAALHARVPGQDERFVQLGAGWLLRQVSVGFSDQGMQAVPAFLQQHRDIISREGLRYAVEKMPPDLRQRQMALETGRLLKRPPRSRKAAGDAGGKKRVKPTRR